VNKKIDEERPVKKRMVARNERLNGGNHCDANKNGRQSFVHDGRLSSTCGSVWVAALPPPTTRTSHATTGSMDVRNSPYEGPLSLDHFSPKDCISTRNGKTMGVQPPETLYEAIATALAALQQDNWVGEIGQGFTTVTVVVQQPPVKHEVRMKDFLSWLGRQGRSPAEVVLKQKLERILGQASHARR